MKKRLIIIILALVLLGGAGTGVWFISDSFYRQTRKRLEVPFKELNLTVCVGEGNDQLKSTYNVVTVGTETKITYTLEEFALFELKNGEYTVPKDRKEKTEGRILAKNGKIHTVNGKKPPLPMELITLSEFSFQRKYFDNATITENTFEADVTDAQALLGLPEECTNVHLLFYFDENHVYTLYLTYTTAQGNAAELQFSFTY